MGRCELPMLAALGLCMETALETPWLSTVFATDASMKGYGVFSSKATLREIKYEACLNDVHDNIEESMWDEESILQHYCVDALEATRASVPRSVAPPGSGRVFRVAYIFSGHRRREDLGWCILELAYILDLQVEVWSIDVSIVTSFDLTSQDFVRKLGAAARAVFFHAVVGCPPRSTWSKANRPTKGGGRPRPLHTRAEPWDTDIQFTASKKMDLWSKLLDVVVIDW
jgi:hypothetical protein